ncbi:Pr6Pr family membrane protein [Leucobacter allii]|uniref:Pr6Pr family membrane protein n=1 Tax=Leucobacter allii TaxID=2932247 RepID=UPI001FD0B570|nr:Pr6Pr family membrane protein [Leucobacter allii]UOR01056.1 Pr6Pr family membrane protein [Leucobacter allii]
MHAPTSRRPLALAIGAVRLAVGLAVMAILGYAYALGVAAGEPNPFDYFGYFTNLTSLLTGGVWIAIGARGIAGLPLPQSANIVRAGGVACMLVVGVVYNTLVPGTGSAPPWVSISLHVAFPALVALDWLLVGDRAPLPWRLWWIVLPYPLLWLAVVLTRGVTDGWVPYGFLLPAHGTASLAAHVAGLCAALIALGLLVWWASRFPGVLDRAAERSRPERGSLGAMPHSGRVAEDGGFEPPRA